MSGDGAGALSEELRRWVDRRADELGVSRTAVLGEALAAYREVVASDGEFEPVADEADLDALADRVTDLDDRLDALAADLDAERDRLAAVEGRDGDAAVDPERVADLDRAVDALGTELDEKIADVRERVIQLKREADAKAPADHDHADLAERIERAAATASEADERATTVERRVDEGFENFEEVLSYLTDTTEELESRASTLARAAVDLRERTATLETERAARRVADEIRATAARNGDRTAVCEACSRDVRLGLLGRPACPHCGTAVTDLEPSRGLFGSATLVTGDPPALEGETATDGADPADLLEETEAETDG
jgi:small-conductance mechanosensitive channel